MKKTSVYDLLRYVAVVGNALFVLWIWYNGLNEGFKATLPQFVSYIGLTGLLALNIALLYYRSKD